MKTLNLKKMATDMNFEDKAKIIFADWNLKRKTHDKEHLLTAEEHQALIDDLYKKNEIDQFNRLIDLYNISSMVAIDIHGGTISLKLAITHVHWFSFALYLKSHEQDRIVQLVSLVPPHDKKKIWKKLEEKNKIDDFLSLLHPKDAQAEKSEPNVRLQDFFENLISATKSLRKTLHILSYIEKKAGIYFLTEDAKRLAKEAEEQIKYVEDLDGFLNIIEIYKKYSDFGLMRKDNFSKPSFQEFIFDHKKVLQLTDTEKKEAEEELEGYMATKRK